MHYKKVCHFFVIFFGHKKFGGIFWCESQSGVVEKNYKKNSNKISKKKMFEIQKIRFEHTGELRGSGC